MAHFTYILKSGKTGKYYVGSCENIQDRLERHNVGATPSTKPGRPWTVVYFETFDTKSEALARERKIKAMKSRLYIENLIAGSSAD
jgi:putative endonuclease